MDNKKMEFPNPMQFRISDAKNHRNTALLQACPIANGRAMGMVQRVSRTKGLGQKYECVERISRYSKYIHAQILGIENHAGKGEELNRQ